MVQYLTFLTLRDQPVQLITGSKAPDQARVTVAVIQMLRIFEYF